MNKDTLIGKIAEAYPGFNEQYGTFVIEVHREFDGPISISHISAGDSNGKKLKGEIDLTSDELIDLIIEVVEEAGALKWGTYETEISLSYEEEVIEVYTKVTNEIWGEL
jgi:hypothetical protein